MIVKTSIVLPTYNESENISILMEKIEGTLSEYQGKFEIIVVDDNSPDKTYAVASQLARNKNWVRTILRIHDKGLSSAILAGFSAAKGDYLIAMDSDMQHDESILPQMIQAFDEGFDIVIGSRKADGGGVVHWTCTRKIISWFAALPVKMILPVNVKDSLSGYFGLTRNVFEKITPMINPRGFKILMEFIVRSHGLRIKEIGYLFRDRQFGKSKLSTGIIVSYLISLYELTIGKAISLQFLKYSFVGLLGVLVNQWGLWYSIQYFNFSSEYALVVGIELSIITNFFLNNHWTFREKALLGFSQLLKGLFKFNLICLMGAIINYSTALFFEVKFGVSIYLGNLVGIIMSTAWNYIVNIKVTWEKAQILS